MERNADICSPLEDVWLMAGAFRICESANSLGRLVFICYQEVVKAFMT